MDASVTAPVASTSTTSAAAASHPHSNRDSISSVSPFPPQPVRANDYDDDDDLALDDARGLLEEDKASSRSRAGSLSFDFSSNLLLASSSEVPTAWDTPGGRRNGSGVDEKISVTAGIALIVGMQIGSGIFSSPGVVARETGAVGSALLAWVGAGLLSWAGASSFAELGSALPLNGGAQAVGRCRAGFCCLCKNYSLTRNPLTVPGRRIWSFTSVLLQLHRCHRAETRLAGELSFSALSHSAVRR